MSSNYSDADPWGLSGGETDESEPVEVTPFELTDTLTGSNEAGDEAGDEAGEKAVWEPGADEATDDAVDAPDPADEPSAAGQSWWSAGNDESAADGASEDGSSDDHDAFESSAAASDQDRVDDHASDGGGDPDLLEAGVSEADVDAHLESLADQLASVADPGEVLIGAIAETVETDPLGGAEDAADSFADSIPAADQDEAADELAAIDGADLEQLADQLAADADVEVIDEPEETALLPGGEAQPVEETASEAEEPAGDAPLSSMLADAISGLGAAEDATVQPQEPVEAEEEPVQPRRSGLGLSRMLAAAQSVFGDSSDAPEDTPTIAEEDLPDELPSWAISDEERMAAEHPRPETPVVEAAGALDVSTDADAEPADRAQTGDPEPEVPEAEQSVEERRDESAAVAETVDDEPLATPEPEQIADVLANLGGIGPLGGADDPETDHAAGPSIGDVATDDAEEIVLAAAVEDSADVAADLESDLDASEIDDRDEIASEAEQALQALTETGTRTADASAETPEISTVDADEGDDGPLPGSMVDGDAEQDAEEAPAPAAVHHIVDDPVSKEEAESNTVESDDVSAADIAGEVTDAPEDTVEVEAPTEDDRDVDAADDDIDPSPTAIAEPEPVLEHDPAATASIDLDAAAEDVSHEPAQDPWGDLEEAPTAESIGIDQPLSTMPAPSVYQELVELSGTAEDQAFAITASTDGADKWGTDWEQAAQGWVKGDDGSTAWRPIVTTAPLLSSLSIDTYLGLVTGDVTVAGAEELGTARQEALASAVGEAMRRGAHAVLGVQFGVHQIGEAAVVTATGTAVTLRSV